MPYSKGDSGKSATSSLSGELRSGEVRGQKIDYSKPIDVKTKSITYSASTPDLLLDLNASSSSTVSKSAPVQAVKVRNDGYVSALASFVYNSYTAEGTIDTDASGLRYVKYLLNPDEEIILPTTRAIIGDAVGEFDGTAIDSAAPNSNEYTDSGANIDDGSGDDIVGSATDTKLDIETWTSEVDNGAYLFRIGDLVRVNNEIMEVTAISNGNDTDGGVSDATNLANTYLTVIRGQYGSTAASDHASGNDIRLPFFNAYHDYDKYSVAQTDSQGRWKAHNFFGYGRALTVQSGLLAGSIAIQFYEAGYAKAGLSDITSNTESGLTASTAYEFDITVDGGTTFSNLSFTVDSSNTKFGGSDGIIAKIQDALDTQYYTAGNLFEKKVIVSLEDGDIVFRSGSYLSTSKIVIGAGSTGTAEFLGTGRIPSAFTSVDARLETEKVYDPITDGATYKQIFIRDDGYGNLIWKNERKVGKINYESGLHSFTVAERPNAEFVVSVLHTSPFSGKLDPTTAGRVNSLRQILGNTPQQKCEAVLTVETF